MIEDLPYVEKYRPKVWEDFVGEETEMVRSLVDNSATMPHLLFVSRAPGTGKTSLAKIIINYLKADSLILNSSDDRKIETVRDKVKKFAQTLSLNPGVPKVVFLDEFDGMLSASQEALRNIMETYYSNCRFILTANSEQKVIDPIKSRCVMINFKTPPKELFAKRIENIIKAEGLIIPDVADVIARLIDLHYPSLRDCLNHLQFVSTSKKDISITDFKTSTEIEQQVYDLMRQGKFNASRELWITNGLKPGELLVNLFRLMMKDPSIDVPKKKKIIEIFAEYDYRLAVGSDPEIQLASLGLLFIRELSEA